MIKERKQEWKHKIKTPYQSCFISLASPLFFLKFQSFSLRFWSARILANDNEKIAITLEKYGCKDKMKEKTFYRKYFEWTDMIDLLERCQDQGWRVHAPKNGGLGIDKDRRSRLKEDQRINGHDLKWESGGKVVEKIK